MQPMTARFSTDLRRLANEHHDNCVGCKRPFSDGDTSHLGYDAAGEPLYVCDACSNRLAETAARYRYSPRPYTLPDPDSLLWRYLDFPKYVSLLATRQLFFARVDTFNDPYEGAKGLKVRKDRWDSHFLEFFRQALRTAPVDDPSQLLSDEEIEKRAPKFIAELEQIGLADRSRTFVSCWHENPVESEAMWRLYAAAFPNALAIRTTYDRLYRSLGKDPDIAIGRVKYIDMRREFAGVNDAFWRKRVSFQHETEVRAMIRDHRATEAGKLVPCDLTTLIEAVFVSPEAPAWFSSVVNDVTTKYGLELKVTPSSLSDPHFF